MSDHKTQHEAVVRRWYQELWSKPDLDVADEIISADYQPDWVQIDKKGPEQIKHEVRYFRSVFPDLVYQVVDMVSAEDRVWVRYRATGTQTGPAWGFPATHRQVSFEGATIFYLDSEGKIADRWGAFCFYDLLADLELVPPFWELKDSLK